MGDKHSLIDFENVFEPIAGVVNNFVDKISNALGWIVTPKDFKPAIIEANKSIIEEIANRQDINPIDRAAIVNSYKRIIREYKNQVDIIRIAAEYLEPGFKANKVSDDWIIFFFDKVKNITEDYMKEIWAKILAGEFNRPDTYTKQLIHTMSIMDSKIAKRFQKIRSSCFFSSGHLYIFMYRTNGGDIKNTKRYEKKKIFIGDLRELDSLGLIQYQFTDFHTLAIDNKVLDYGDKKVTLNTKDRSIALGNVALTSTGKQLCRIVPMEYDDDILEICVEAWEKLGYNPVVEQIGDDESNTHPAK